LRSSPNNSNYFHSWFLAP